METPQPLIVNIAYKAPVVIAMFFVGLYGMYTYIDYNENSIHLTNAAFAVTASLAALSFTYAGTKAAKSISDRLIFAGEKLLHGAILLIVTSVIKYMLFQINSAFNIETVHIAFKLIFGLVSILGAVIFINGLLFSHTGLRILNDVLILRMTRHKDWDDTV